LRRGYPKQHSPQLRLPELPLILVCDFLEQQVKVLQRGSGEADALLTVVVLDRKSALLQKVNSGPKSTTGSAKIGAAGE
jgi:hypothetical protein